MRGLAYFKSYAAARRFRNSIRANVLYTDLFSVRRRGKCGYKVIWCPIY